MSNVKIKANASGTADFTIQAPATDTAVTMTLPESEGTIATTNQLGRRNLIINGAMQVAQRGTQVTGVTTDGLRTCDRFVVGVSSLGTWTVDQSTDSPDGFSNSFKLTTTTADASPASGDYALFQTNLEAQNLQHLGYGTSNAKTITLSFWVKSNKTGNASFDVLQSDNSSKLLSTSYTINTADTWEYKTITISADTAGVINNDNGRGLQLTWWLNSGSTFSSGSHTTWSTYSNPNRNVSNLGVGGATSDYFAITGVQLEVGSVATPFEHRSFGEELALCQRYYEIVQAGWIGDISATGGDMALIAPYKTKKRANPSLTAIQTYENCCSSVTASHSLDYDQTLGGTAYASNMVVTGVSKTWSVRFSADAEL